MTTLNVELLDQELNLDELTEINGGGAPVGYAALAIGGTVAVGAAAVIYYGGKYLTKRVAEAVNK